MNAEHVCSIDKVLKYLDEWNEAKKDDREALPTQECLYDLRCSLVGLKELYICTGYVIRPGFINSDLIELHFSQVRELFHNQTPHIKQYANVQNSIILGQPLAGLNSKSNISDGYPKPFCMYKK